MLTLAKAGFMFGSSTKEADMTDVMQKPEEYVRLCLDLSAGDKRRALAQLLRAVRDEPIFKHVPATWLADVVLAMANA